jgi:hypothetical protein
VRAEGFEPSRSFEHGHLKPACLPFHHARKLHERTAPLADNFVSVAPRTLIVKGANGCDPQKSSTPYSASSLLV